MTLSKTIMLLTVGSLPNLRMWKVGVRIPGRIKSKIKHWHLLLPWLAFTI